MAEEKVKGKVQYPLTFPLLQKYDPSEVKIEDRGLAKYICLEPRLFLGAQHANKQFGKAKVYIVERLINNMMRTEHYNGKKMKAYKAVEKAFDIIAQRTKKNPIQVLVDAIQNAAPKEEVTRLYFGGISVPKSVDIAPLRRLDIALRNLCLGAVSKGKVSRGGVEKRLADEIIKAANNDSSSYAISQKEEIERIARSAR
ncbi:MAG TPA: 30S ribosomal protein S7 [Thermoplasmatales archaeon]|nr:30S ribosomal protein S7 [Thermoplasmatales archaeon]